MASRVLFVVYDNGSYDKQRDNTLQQIKYLYDTKDVTFRGFRHNGRGQTALESGKVNENIPSESFQKKSKRISGNVDKSNGDKKNKSIGETRNWEISNTDGERFSQQNQNIDNENKNEKSFDNYLKRKTERFAAKKASNQKTGEYSKEKSII